MISSFPTRARRACQTFLVLCVAVACGDEPSPATTQVVVELTADSALPIARVEITVRGGATTAALETTDTRSISSPTFPLVTSIVPRDNDGSRAFEYDAYAYAAGGGDGDHIGHVRGFGHFASGTQRALALHFHASCEDAPCSPQESCDATGCTDADVVASDLPLYDPTPDMPCRRVAIPNLDLLLVVDNSNSMGEEQDELAEQLPALIAEITADTAEFESLESVHVGVVSTDMGTGGFEMSTCVEPEFGDDGILIGSSRGPDCTVTAPSFLDFVPGRDDAALLGADAACLARLGTGGCGYEQQFEATLKALTPASSDLRFFDETVGHGDGVNAGFLRPDSLLVVLFLTDENDCSVSDSELLDRTSPRFTPDLNLRCFRHPGAVHPVDRYVEGLLRLREDPSTLLVVSLVGIPPEIPVDEAFEAILEHAGMEERPSDEMPSQLAYACPDPEHLAFPSRRFVELAQGLETGGANAVVRSICQDDFQEPRLAISVAARRILRTGRCAEE